MKNAKIYGFADFETLPVKGNESRNDLVCAWGLKMSNNNDYYFGIDTISFLEQLINLPEKRGKGTEIIFHNFSGFDGWFFVKLLPKLGLTQRKFTVNKKVLRKDILSPYKENNTIKKRKKWAPNEYSLICNKNGKIIQLKISLLRKKLIHFITFKCSLLLLPNQSLSALGEKVGLEKLGLISGFRKTPFKDLKEFENDEMYWYLIRDVDILKKIFVEITKTVPKHRLKITIGSTGYNEWLYHSCKSIERFYIKEYSQDWKTEINDDGYEIYYKGNKKIWSTENTKRLIEKLLPTEWIKDHETLRKWFKGGLTMAHPKKLGIVYKNVFHCDINSSYPSILKSNLILPWGLPFIGDGGEKFPCKLWKITAISNLVNKSGLPFVGFKRVRGNVLWYNSTIRNDTIIYISSAEIFNFEKYYKGLYKKECYISFKGIPACELFADFISFYSNLKITAKLSGDKIIYLFTKLIQNSVYGKFSTNNHRASKIFNPEKQAVNWDKLPPSEKTSFENIVELENATFYLPIGIFITGYARQKLVEAVADRYNENFIYADTDSIFMTNRPLLKYDNTRLGSWSIESENAEFMTVGKKRYLLKENGEQKIVMAGFYVDKDLKLDFNDLIVGFSVVNTHRKETKWGIELMDITKELKPIWTPDYERPDECWFTDKESFYSKREALTIGL